MRNRLFGVLVCALLASSRLVWGAEIPEDLKAAVLAAEQEGRTLFEASSQSADETIVKEARSKIADFCPFEYTPVVVSDEKQQMVYFVAEAPSQHSLIFGRHYKVVGDTVTVSTKTCVGSGIMPSNAVAATVSHLLSPSPSAFHVFLSLKASKSVYVGTERGVWVVTNGSIAFVKER